MFTFAICYRPSICLSSVTLVRPTQAAEIFGNISKAFGTQGIPPPGELNARGVPVAEYSDFGPIEGYISKTVQDRKWVCINH